MKKILLSSFAIILLFLSCNKKEENTNPGTIEFVINSPGSNLKSTAAFDSSKIVYAVVTIKDKNGALVYNNEELPIYRMGNAFITKPLSLNPGEYTLTGFLISNTSKEITFATPLSTSSLGYLVKYALPYKFTVGGDQVLKVAPEIISSTNVNPSEFGYSSFSMTVVETFNINVSAFIYNSTIKNYELTDASLKISYQVDTINATLQLANRTNQIALPDKPVTYTLTATKPGYNSITFTYSNSEVKNYQTKPLMFVFNPTSNLVAHFPFNGNVNDYSGLNNHGTLFGTVAANDKNDALNKAYSFDGVDDYVRVPNSPSLNPTDAITVAAWYKTTPFIGSGVDPIVNKAYISHIEPYYQYHLGVCGNQYWNAQSRFSFYLSINDKLEGVNTENNIYSLNTWYHLVGTYDGTTIKIYVNGLLAVSKDQPGKMRDLGSDLYIGRHKNSIDGVFYHLPGTIDDVRIYNVALTANQVLSLYQQ